VIVHRDARLDEKTIHADGAVFKERAPVKGPPLLN
jgi:hypothetical protein